MLKGFQNGEIFCEKCHKKTESYKNTKMTITQA